MLKLAIKISRYAISIILLFAILAKVLDPTVSIEFIKNLLMIGSTVSWILVALIVLIESFIAVSLLIYIHQKWPLYASGFLFAVFSLVILYAVQIELPLSCGCFGPILEQEVVNYREVIRNVLLSILSFSAGWYAYQD